MSTLQGKAANVDTNLGRAQDSTQVIARNVRNKDDYLLVRKYWWKRKSLDLGFCQVHLKYHEPIQLSNLSYCPLIWLFCSKTANNDINRTHKRALRILYRDYESSFEELIERDNTKTIHTKNLQKLMIEVYKSLNHLNPEYMWEFFVKKDVQYYLRTKELCKLPSVSSQRYGLNSISFRGSLFSGEARQK